MTEDSKEIEYIKRLERRIKRYFFAEEHFRQNDMNEYWLNEMKYNREWLLKTISDREQKENDKLQMKLFNKRKS